MNIAIETTALESEHKYRGIGFYTANLIRALEKYDKKNKYTKFVRTQNLPKNVSLVHYPYLDLFARTLKVSKNVKTAVTVHDLIPIKFPEHFPAGIKGKFNWQWQKWMLQKVDAIITDSYCSKKDIHNLAEIPEKRIHVVYLAHSPKFRKIKNTSLLRSIEVKYKLPKRFILYVGDVNWNKNVPSLIKAFAKLKTQNSKLKTTTKNLKLILVGRAFLNEETREVRGINKLIKQLNLESQISKMGFVPTKDLVEIYNLATVYVQPSFYEGFGLPCLEAMVYGCPVVAGNTPALREICGKAVVYVNPYKSESIADGILKVINYHTEDVGKYQELRERGFRQIKKFNWKRVAEETVEVYKSVLRG